VGLAVITVAKLINYTTLKQDNKEFVMETSNLIEHINTKSMRGAVKHYSWTNNLYPPEAAALKCVPNAEGQPILDLGVGAGRTSSSLLEISQDYIGIDYVKEMVDNCRKKFPNVRFEQADARDMSQFADNSFYMIFFSLNGISMVDHEGRLKILSEVRRLLKPGGYFLFSTYNQDNKDYQKLLHLPRFQMAKNPIKFAVRGSRFIKELGTSVINRARYKKLEVHLPDYSMVNDKCHNYATMLYYITQDNMKKQLRDSGFSGEIKTFDLSGKQINGSTLDDSIFYVVSV